MTKKLWEFVTLRTVGNRKRDTGISQAPEFERLIEVLLCRQSMGELMVLFMDAFSHLLGFHLRKSARKVVLLCCSEYLVCHNKEHFVFLVDVRLK